MQFNVEIVVFLFNILSDTIACASLPDSRQNEVQFLQRGSPCRPFFTLSREDGALSTSLYKNPIDVTSFCLPAPSARARVSSCSDQC
jgi:hypothetical protein